MINRVAGVFARRGFNIESLAVGLNIDRALFTIVVIGSDAAIAQLIKQIYKLPNVIKVEDLTYASCVERGLMLVKVDAVPPQRSAILELAGIFRAAVVDVTERSIMLAVTGDPGKTRAFQRAMSAFGVLAVARTGAGDPNAGQTENLDAITAVVLGVKEGNMVLELIRRVRDKGLPVVLISHNMPHVFEVADRIHIARLGKRAAVVNPKFISMSDTVAVMTGAKAVGDLPPEALAY